MATDDPATWTPPDWHPDFGDPEAELEMLRTFAIHWRGLGPDRTVSLDSTEPGYLELTISRRGHVIGHLCIVPGNPADPAPRFGFFGLGDRAVAEFSFRSVEEGIRLLDGPPPATREPDSSLRSFP